MASALFKHLLVVVRGGGDLASGVVYRLHRAGFPVVITELAAPKLVRRTVSYGEAVYSKTITIEGITAKLVSGVEEALSNVGRGTIPVIVDEGKAVIQLLNPVVIVDARMEKTALDAAIADAPLVIALGPGYTIGVDCHAIIETNRGHNLGRVIWDGTAEPDTGTPGSVGGQTHFRVLRAPVDGYVEASSSIGDEVEEGQIIAKMGDYPITAPFKGVLRGLVSSQVWVTAGMKIGDVDPRAQREHCFSISDKSLAIGGGVLEAIFSATQIRTRLQAMSHETSPGV